MREREGREASPSAAIIDSQSANAAQKGGASMDPQGYDAGKRVARRKRHILVDTLGLLLSVVVHPANVQDRDDTVSDRRKRAVPEALAGVLLQGPHDVLGVFLGLVFVKQLTPALAQSNAPSDNSYCDVHNGWNHMMGWGYGMYGGIGMLLFWGVIIVLLVFAARSFMGGRWSQPQPGSTALDILKERYAKGEIDKPEYEERRKMLMD